MEGVPLIFLKANYILLLISLSLRKTGFLSFFPSTSHPPPQPWAHSKSSCYVSLILYSPLLIVPKPFSTLKVKVPLLHEVETASVFFFFNRSFSGPSTSAKTLRLSLYCDHQCWGSYSGKYSHQIVILILPPFYCYVTFLKSHLVPTLHWYLAQNFSDRWCLAAFTPCSLTRVSSFV